MIVSKKPLTPFRGAGSALEAKLAGLLKYREGKESQPKEVKTTTEEQSSKHSERPTACEEAVV